MEREYTLIFVIIGTIIGTNQGSLDTFLAQFEYHKEVFGGFERDHMRFPP